MTPTELGWVGACAHRGTVGQKPAANCKRGTLLFVHLPVVCMFVSLFAEYFEAQCAKEAKWDEVKISCNLTLSITRLLSSRRMIDYVFVIAPVNNMDLVKQNMTGNIWAHVRTNTF